MHLCHYEPPLLAFISTTPSLLSIMNLTIRGSVWLSISNALLALAPDACQYTWSECTGTATSGRHALRLASFTTMLVLPSSPFVQREFLWGSVDLPCPGARKAQASGRSCEAGLPDSVAERRLAFPTTGKLFIVGSCYGTLRSAFCLVYCRRERSRLSSSEWAAQLLGGYEDELPLFSSWVVHFIYRGLHIRGSALCLSSID